MTSNDGKSFTCPLCSNELQMHPNGQVKGIKYRCEVKDCIADEVEPAFLSENRVISWKATSVHEYHGPENNEAIVIPGLMGELKRYPNPNGLPPGSVEVVPDEILEYDIIADTDLERLTSKVTKLLADGWTLQGGVVTATLESYGNSHDQTIQHATEFYQAVIKEEP